jgi:molybdopterin-containing oxidoreductase family membrane subunit
VSARQRILGVFERPADAAAAVREVRERGFREVEAYSPVPVEELIAALPGKPPVRWFTLLCGLGGFVGGMALAVLTSLIYNLVVGGKPPAAFVPYLIISFESTILLGGLGTLVGLLIGARLPRRKAPPLWDARLSEDRYGVAVECNPEALELLARIFAEHGAEDVLRA